MIIKEFIKLGDNYLIKDSNGRIVSEEEKLRLERNELILEDINSNDCVKETNKKIKKVSKKLKEVEDGTNTIEETIPTKE